MDEPTAPLTPKEVETLFSIARRLRDEGRTIVFISHRLEEVRALCDRVTIFRDGNKVATDGIDKLTDAEIIRLMIGRPLKDYMHKAGAQIGDVALKVDGLTAARRLRGHQLRGPPRRDRRPGRPRRRGTHRCRPRDLRRRPGRPRQIVDRRQGGEITEPADAIALGLAFVPEDRAVAGIFRTLSVEQNITAAVPGKIAPRGFIRRAVEKAMANE